MVKKPTKIERLVAFLQQKAKAGKTVTRKQVLSRFKNDQSMIVYFNGLRRNGAISESGQIYVTKIKKALVGYRKRNSTVQKQHYARREWGASIEKTRSNVQQRQRNDITVL